MALNYTALLSYNIGH